MDRVGGLPFCQTVNPPRHCNINLPKINTDNYKGSTFCQTLPMQLDTRHKSLGVEDKICIYFQLAEHSVKHLPHIFEVDTWSLLSPPKNPAVDPVERISSQCQAFKPFSQQAQSNCGPDKTVAAVLVEFPSAGEDDETHFYLCVRLQPVRILAP